MINIERYQILDKLGSGGMGAVFKARDLLSGEIVALKQVNTTAAGPDSGGPHTTADVALALASEFRTLAALHHPHIVAVLDYGFDSERKPYYTMQLLEGAQPLTATEADRSLADKVRLIVETLQALTYLHRHGVVHSDLKPANVLVTALGTVKVLDFGLAKSHDSSMQAHMEKGLVGTIAYMAPEIFQEEEPTIQSDLYAVGVMAYELFAGRHPFNTKNMALLVSSILNSQPDFQMLDEPLAEVLEKLLRKAPAERYSTADDVIRALLAATHQPPLPESAAVRESFLQASAFVGREREMRLLRDALTQAQSGKGSAWLIGGESGIGKSRLLEEIRTRALVQGALVLRGQAVAEGGLPYQLWRDSVRRLLLAADISDFEASVLKEIVPDIGGLLGRDVADAPMLSGKPGQLRLIQAIKSVFMQQTQPIVLLLEDAQWASESLEPLKALNEHVESRPWLILASYRDDEAPDLPGSLPSMKVMTLPRFPASAVTDLTVAMLGEAGRRADLVERLHEETEGNAFFLVEVVRALAEEAGSLDAVATTTLPRHIITGGVLQVTRRRLAKIPAAGQEALKLAAVAGRQIDLPLLDHLKVVESLDNWLTVCANASVLEPVDGSWRFAHDKLRETVLADLSTDQRPTLHRRIAEGIEAIHPDDVAYAEALAAHWEQAGDYQKAVSYILKAATQMIDFTADYRRAEHLLEHGLDLTPAEDRLTRARLYRWIGNLLAKLSEFQRAAEVSILSLENSQDDPVTTAWALDSLCNSHWRQGNFAEASACAESGLTLARQIDDWELIAQHQSNMGIIAANQGRFDEAYTFFNEALNIRSKANSKTGMSNSLNNLGIVTMYQGKLAESRQYLTQAMTLNRELGDRAAIGNAQNNLALVAEHEGDYQAAETYLNESVAMFREVGNRLGVAAGLANLGNTAIHQGQYSKAHTYLQESLDIRRAIGDQWGVGSTLSSMGDNACGQGDYAAAEAYCNESLELYRKLDSKEGIAVALITLGKVQLERGILDQAQAQLNEAQSIALEIGSEQLSKAQAYLCLVLMRQGDLPAARQMLREGLQTVQPRATTSKIAVLHSAVQLSQAEQPADAAAWAAMLDRLPELNDEFRCSLQALRPALQSVLGMEAYQVAMERGSSLNIDSVIQGILAEN
jgi:tetratricopeptide (TPR) repeat protein